MEQIVRFDLTDTMTVGITHNYETNTCHLDFHDENYRRCGSNQLLLNGKDTRLFLQQVPTMNLVFLKILGGEWDLVEKKDLSETLNIKISAEEIPKIKITTKTSRFRWSRFEMKCFEWSRLSNVLLSILKKLCDELDNIGYEIPDGDGPKGYRWKMIKLTGRNSIYKVENFAGPWQRNIHNVLNNCNEFMKRNYVEEGTSKQATMVIEMLSKDNQTVKTLGPMSVPKQSHIGV